MNPRNIFIRHYRRVPLADLQLLMPETTPAMRGRPVDMLTFASLGLGVGIAAVPLLLPAKLCTWLGATWASATAQLFAAGGSVLALGKLIGRYRFTRAYYAEAVASAAATNHAYSDA